MDSTVTTVKTEEKSWEDLTLEQKMVELGFTEGTNEERMHAALDQLFDAGKMLVDIEEMTEPTAKGKPDGDALNTLVTIYELIHGDHASDDA